MDFKILDASAFYAGIPFKSTATFHTTPQVYDEISHIKKSHGALEALTDVGRLKIIEPDKEALDAAVKAAKDTGDYPQLSEQDVSIIALCIQTRGQVITDDYAVSNVARNLKLDVLPVMTRGIRDVGVWVHYCPACRKDLKGAKECPACGTRTKRKLLK